jgi:hypothetical protein
VVGLVSEAQVFGFWLDGQVAGRQETLALSDSYADRPAQSTASPSAAPPPPRSESTPRRWAWTFGCGEQEGVAMRREGISFLVHHVPKIGIAPGAFAYLRPSGTNAHLKRNHDPPSQRADQAVEAL